MKKITTEDLNEILENHKKWLNNDGGKKADLREANLIGVNLRGADLREANLIGVNLRGAYLSKANLSEADLSGADLKRADLSGADLRGAALRGVNLRYADLIHVDLRYVNLIGADLTGAKLLEANLSKADLTGAILRDAYLNYTNLTQTILFNTDLNNVIYDETTIFLSLQCPEEGSFIGYKKANDKIVKLLITKDSLRSSATSRKCRCSKAKVLSITNIENTGEFEMVQSDYDENFIYKVGEIVEVKDFDKNRWNECSSGIHFFITREEAVNY